MCGSTTNSTAIESLLVIAVRLSDSYQLSAYCPPDAEYAFARQRQIIARRMTN